VIKAVISQSIVDVSRLLHAPIAEGNPVKRENDAALSPYLICHVKRLGDYDFPLSNVVPWIIPVSGGAAMLSHRELPAHPLLGHSISSSLVYNGEHYYASNPENGGGSHRPPACRLISWRERRVFRDGER
jgi:hypothetical protein